MSFENVQLSSSVIADLYRQSLVVLDDVQPNPKKTAKKRNAAEPGGLAVVADKMVLDEPEKILLPIPVIPVPEEVKPFIKYMGEFNQGVSIVIAEPGHEHILPEDLEFLEKMMAACKLTVADMAIINVVTNQPAAKQLWQLMPAKVVLMFDVTTSAIGIPFYQPDFKVQHWDNAQFLNAPSLAAFRGRDTPELKGLKRKLWEALQKIFLEK